MSRRDIIEVNTFDKACQKAIKEVDKINMQREHKDTKTNNDLSI